MSDWKRYDWSVKLEPFSENSPCAVIKVEGVCKETGDRVKTIVEVMSPEMGVGVRQMIVASQVDG